MPSASCIAERKIGVSDPWARGALKATGHRNGDEIAESQFVMADVSEKIRSKPDRTTIPASKAKEGLLRWGMQTPRAWKVISNLPGKQLKGGAS